MMMLRCALLVCVSAAPRKARSDPNELSITFLNPYDSPYDLYWISDSNDTVQMGTIAPNGESSLNSFVGHSFGWRRSGGEEQCDAAELEHRVTLVRGLRNHVLGSEVELPDDYRPDPSEDLRPFNGTFVNMGSTKTALVPALNLDVESTDKNPTRTLLLPGESVALQIRTGALVDWFDAATDELLYRTVVEYHGHRRHVYRDEGYTTLCGAETPKSRPVREFVFVDELDGGRELKVEVLSETPFIAFMPQWTAGTECAELERQAKSRGLSGAQVFGQRGVIADRRALSANLYWSDKNSSAITNTLIRRAFAFTKEQRGYDIVPGSFQEPLNFIEYDFAGEYRPHCDGVCHKTPYSTGGRVATLIHYCKAATIGGATVFPKTGLKVVPEPNSAILFSYKQDDGNMDDGNTQHTGCLVQEGPKQIVTMWMREDANPSQHWDSFMS